MIKKIILILMCLSLVGCSPVKQEEFTTTTIGFNQADEEAIKKLIYDENYFFPFLLQQKYIYTKFKTNGISVNFYNNAKFDALFNVDGSFNYNFSFQPNEIKLNGKLVATLLTSYSYVPDYYDSHLLAYITIDGNSNYYEFDQNRVELVDYTTKEVVTIDDTIQSFIIELLKEQWNQMMEFRVLCEEFSMYITHIANTEDTLFTKSNLPIQGFVGEWEDNLNGETGIYEPMANIPIIELIKINNDEIKNSSSLSPLESLATVFFYIDESIDYDNPNYDQLLGWLFSKSNFENEITLEDFNKILSHSFNLSPATIDYDLILKNGITQDAMSQTYHASIMHGVTSDYSGLIMKEEKPTEAGTAYTLIPYQVTIDALGKSKVTINNIEFRNEKSTEEDIVTYLENNIEILPHWYIEIDNEKQPKLISAELIVD